MLTQEQLKRYSRNIAVPGIGQDGQLALLDSKVLIVGAGGLGSPAVLYLAAAGIGTIGIVDADRVELSNLQRQILYNSNSLGRVKTAQAKEAILTLNPDINVNCYEGRIDTDNANQIISAYDIVLDGSDNFATRFIVNKACHDNKKPLVSGAVKEFSGQVGVFASYLKDEPCYQCFCPTAPNLSDEPACSRGGILGAVTGIIGSLMANIAIKHIIKLNDNDISSLLIYDGILSTFRTVKINKDTACVVCS